MGLNGPITKLLSLVILLTSKLLDWNVNNTSVFSFYLLLKKKVCFSYVNLIESGSKDKHTD